MVWCVFEHVQYTKAYIITLKSIIVQQQDGRSSIWALVVFGTIYALRRGGEASEHRFYCC